MRVISLGWGVQSWTMAAMVALGELEPVDYVIHADTTWEQQATYQFAVQWTPWLEERGVRVVTVSDAEIAKQIIDDSARVMAPVHTLNHKNAGQMRRVCTDRWKITPLRRFVSVELSRLGLPKSAGIVDMWLGITMDEWQRAKDSQINYIVNRFPLLDKKFTRQDCLNWLQAHGLPSPGKSACTFCPYHSRKMWQEMKRNNGADWAQAVMVDEKIRTVRPGYQSFVHSDLIPLTQVKLPEDYGTQLQLLDFDDKDAECDSGFCFL